MLTFNQFLIAEEKKNSDIQDFIKFAASKLKLKDLPTFDLDHDAHSYRSFGGYSEDGIGVATRNRHTMDVCRTIAHELVHYKQDKDGKLKYDGEDGKAGSPMENEANAKAAVIMRAWADERPELFKEACWDGYRKEGMKKKGNRVVPNCVPIKEEIEHNPVKVNAYHGSNKRFSKFDQKLATIPNDYYGGGVAYTTDSPKVGISYAKTMTRARKTGSPHVYHVGLDMKNVFDVDHEFTGDKLKHVLPDNEKEHENFARGAGLLRLGGEDKYKVLSKLRSGEMKLTGAQVFKGLSGGMINTARARDHLIRKGYDGLRYNGGENMDTERHNVYIPYNADSITINKVSKVVKKPKPVAEESLGKIQRTPGGPKKFAVKVKNDKGNVVTVRFGDPNMEIKRDDPERRKSFRARHQCDTNPGPRWKARYWSCRQWRSGKKVEG
jgi:hypothetical protein